MTEAIKIIQFWKNGVENLSVKFSLKNNRDKSDQKLENHIKTVWHNKLTKNSRLWNATKFRLSELVEREHDAMPIFHIGITDYRDYCTTDYNNPFHYDFYPNKMNHLARKIAVGGVLLSNDNHIMLQKRASWVNVYPGKFDVPGGHPEPSNIDDLVNIDSDFMFEENLSNIVKAM